MQLLKKKSPPSAEQPPRRRLKKKMVLLSMLSLILVGAIAAGAAVLFAPAAQAAVLTGETTYGSFAQTLEGTGITMPAESDTYTTVSDSEILEVLVSAGDTVKQGDLLYVQDDSEVDEVQDDYLDQISDYEDQISGYRDQIAEWQETLTRVTVTAPLSGRIHDVNLEEGDTVKEGDVLCTIVSDSSMTLTEYFSYTYESQIYLGQTAQLSIPDLMTSLSGTVTEIRKVERVTSEGVKCFAVTITVENPGALSQGMEAGACLLDGTEKIYPSIEGTLDNQGEKTVKAGCSGELLSVQIEDYETVSEGQVLFAVDGSDYQKQIQDCEDQIARAQTRIDTLQTRIAEEEEGRAGYAVTSDIDGKVIMVRIQAGDTPQKGATAVMVYDLTKMSISASVDELDIDYLSAGMTARIVRSGAEEDEEYEGNITEVGLEATSSGGVSTFPVTIEIDSGGLLSAGVNVSYYISVGDDDGEGVLAPVAAVQYLDEGTALFVQSQTRPENAMDLEGGIVPEGFWAIPVEVGVSSGQQVRILSGAEEGMTVFTGYQQSAPTGGESTSQSQEQTGTMQPPSGEDFPSGGFPGGSSGGMGGGRPSN